MGQFHMQVTRWANFIDEMGQWFLALWPEAWIREQITVWAALDYLGSYEQPIRIKASKIHKPLYCYIKVLEE